MIYIGNYFGRISFFYFFDILYVKKVQQKSQKSKNNMFFRLLATKQFSMRCPRRDSNPGPID